MNVTQKAIPVLFQREERKIIKHTYPHTLYIT